MVYGAMSEALYLYHIYIYVHHIINCINYQAYKLSLKSTSIYISEKHIYLESDISEICPGTSVLLALMQRLTHFLKIQRT